MDGSNAGRAITWAPPNTRAILRRSGRLADEALSAGAAARRLGVAVTTLRTWHQRYGLGPSRHIPGQHRRYTSADLRRLEIMRRLTADGVTPAVAARLARHAPDVPAATTTLTTDAVTTDAAVAATMPATGVPEADPAGTGAGWAAPPHPARTGRDGGGATIPVGRAGPAARGLARAAMRLDSVAMAETIGRALATDGVTATWNRLLRPVLAGIGERHATTARLVEVEHLLSRCVSEALAMVTRRGLVDPVPRVLLSCADEEQHTLALEALAAALAETGIGCRMLGARVPVVALRDAVARTGPEVVALWSHAPATADPAQFAALLSIARRPPLLIAAGPGWSADALPSGVACPADLTEAVSLVRATRSSPVQSPPTA